MPPETTYALGSPGQHDRHVDRDLLTRHQLLKVDVQDLLFVRVTLNLADQRAGDSPIEGELDDRALRRDALEELLELARGDRERQRLARVTVDDGRDLPGAAKRSRGALATGSARARR